MITAQDLEYHTPPNAGHTWAETYFFPIAVPEEHLMATVYVVVRPGLGVMVNDIAVYGALADTRADLLYFDVQPHLPAPERWSRIDAPSGLKVSAVNPPRDYRIDYVGYDDTEIHVDWTGVMEPFDIHDPAHSPRAQRSVERQHAGSGLGEAWGGHFDMTGHVQGTLRVRGREFAVDSLERMDHSWGHREPITMNAQNSISAAFPGGTALHVITVLDPQAPNGADHTFAHGYLLEGGQVYGLTDVRLTSNRLGSVVVSLDMELTDVRGEQRHLRAVADVGAPWNPYAATLTWTAQMTWFLGDQVGHGCVMETRGIPGLNRMSGRWWTDQPHAYVCG